MLVRDDLQGYDHASILLHWAMAVLIFGLFFLGRYMVDLDYYHPWYLKAPNLHRSLGAITGLLLVFRLGWRLTRPYSSPLGKPWERRMAVWVHRLFYVLIATAVLAGYLLTTADGQPVSIFGWVKIPATIYGFDNQEDIAGEWHLVLTHVLFFLAITHGLAVLKHHFIDHDATLRRMVQAGAASPSPSTTNAEE